MIYVILGIVILCASFLIALITLMREQKKIEGDESAQAGSDPSTSSGQVPSNARPFDSFASAQDKSAQVIDSEVVQIFDSETSQTRGTRGGLQQDALVDEEKIQISNEQESKFPWEERAQARRDLASTRQSLLSNTNRINGVIIPRDISEKK